MSTVIYDAYRSKNPLSLAQINKSFERLKQQEMARAKRKISIEVAEFIFRGFAEGRSENEIDKELRDEIRKGGILLDLELKRSVAYFKHFQGFDYVMLGWVKTDGKDRLVEELNLEDYSYWDNVDRPDCLSEDEWCARGETWNQVVDKFSLTDSGFCTFELVTDKNTRMMAREAQMPDVLRGLLDDEEMVNRIRQDFIIDKLCSRKDVQTMKEFREVKARVLEYLDAENDVEVKELNTMFLQKLNEFKEKYLCQK